MPHSLQGRGTAPPAPSPADSDPQDEPAAMDDPAPTAGPSNPLKALDNYVKALNSELVKIVQHFEVMRLVRGETNAASHDEINSLVDSVLDRLPAYENGIDITKMAMEKALENAIISLVRLHVSCLVPSFL